ncbi:MAG: hypothetical protein ACERKO_11900 [Acetanaerobacterium sp.]
MKIGKREQILLFVLLLVVIWVVPARFIFVPAMENYTSNLATRDEMETKKLEMQTLILANEGMDQKITDAADAAAQRSARFFPPFENEQMGLWMYGYTEEAGLRSSQVNIGERSLVQITDYSDVVPELRIALSDLVDQISGQSLPAGGETSGEEVADYVFVNTVTVTADCYYDNLMYFIDLLLQSGRTLQVSGVTFHERVDASAVKGVLTATVTLQVYSVPKFYADDILNVSFDAPKGKEKLT